jgi:hypothetical protein
MSDGNTAAAAPPPGRAPVSLIRCLDRGVCERPVPQVEGHIRAPPVGTRESMLLWPTAPPSTVVMVKKWRDVEAAAATSELGTYLRERYGATVMIYEDEGETVGGDGGGGGGGRCQL